MNRQLKQRELQLEQQANQLSAEEQLLQLDIQYQEARKEIQEGFDMSTILFNARVEIALAEYPEPESTKEPVAKAAGKAEPVE